MGFPHSDISGSKLVSSSPKRFVGNHVLHRLLMPRHPPCALISLTYLSPLHSGLTHFANRLASPGSGAEQASTLRSSLGTRHESRMTSPRHRMSNGDRDVSALLKFLRYSIFKVRWVSSALIAGRACGDEGARTPDPRLAKAVLSQLSYIPRVGGLVGLCGLEPQTSRLSAVRSNHLS